MDTSLNRESDGWHLYKKITERYCTNESGAYNLGFAINDEWVLAYILRRLGVGLKRYVCKVNLDNSTQYFYALEVERRLVKMQGECSWDQIIQKHHKRFPLENEGGREIVEISVEEDMASLQRCGTLYKSQLLSWANAEIAFIKGAMLDEKTALCQTGSRPSRL